MLRSLLLCLLLGIVVARKDPFYRKDYTYFYSYDAFYKFHGKDGVSSWMEAFTKCGDEGATLFYPSLDEEYSVVTYLKDKVPTYNGENIFIGIHDVFHVGEFITIDGSTPPYTIPDKDLTPDSTTRCVSLSLNQEEYKVENCTVDDITRNKGFICKRAIKTPVCPTVDDGYKFNENTGNCYKIVNQPKTWEEAYEKCYMEGASLYLPDNEKEYQEVYDNFIQPNNVVRNRDDENYSFFIGAKRAMPGGEIFTTKGVPIVKESYQVWKNTEPQVPAAPQRYSIDSDYSDVIPPWIRPSRDCVALTWQYLNNIGHRYCFSTESCSERHRFICKMKANGS